MLIFKLPEIKLYLATGACCNAAFNQQLNQWYFIILYQLTIWYINVKNNPLFLHPPPHL